MGPLARARAAATALRLRLTLPLVFERQGLTALLAGFDARAASAGSGDAAELTALLERAFRPLRFWRTTCLWRALAGYAALRAAGVDVRFLIGVRPGEGGQVTAHAWLERGGEPSIGAPAPGAGYQVAFAWPADPARLSRAEVQVAALRTSAEAILTELRDGTGVILDLKTRSYLTLNRTGVIAWKRLATGAQDVAQVAAAVSAEHPEVDPAVVAEDVRELVAELQAEGLVQAQP